MVLNANSSGGLGSKALPFEKVLTSTVAPPACQPGTTASKIEIAFAVFVLTLSTGAFVNLFPGEHGIGYWQEGMIFAQVLWSLIYLVMLCLIRNQIAEFVRLLWRERFLSLLLGWACSSVLWSIDRQVTFRHFVPLAASTIFGIYLGVRYELRTQLRYLTMALAIVTIASALACIAFPAYGIAPANELGPEGWQGVFAAKNNLGTIAVLQTLVLALLFAEGYHKGIALIGLAFTAVVIIQTASKSALVYLVVAMLAFPIVRAIHRNPAKSRKIAVIALLLFGGIATWVYQNWETVTYSLGKDPGLTGRFELWAMAPFWIRDRPLLGYGYDAFWSDYYGPAADFRIASGWLGATHAHNGLINLWLDLGLIGVLLFSLCFVIAYSRAIALVKQKTTVEAVWPVIFLTFLLVYSLTEIGFMTRDNLYWILFVSLLTGLRHDLDHTSWKGLVSRYT